MEAENKEKVESQNVEEKVVPQKTEEKVESPKAEAKDKEKPSRPRVRPKLFFNPDEKVKVQVSAFYNAETGHLEFCVPGAIKESGNELILVVHEFDFSQVPYDRLNVYRIQSTVYNSEDRTNSLNILRLRNYFWTFHLKNWNYTDENDKPIPLTHDPNGALSNESLQLVYKIPTAILDMAVGIFEKEINLA